MTKILPRVSYIVLANSKNRNQTEKTVDSILSQGYKNIEVIIIGSHKHKLDKLVHKYKSSRIKYHQSLNEDLADDLGYGLGHANGDFISWVSSGVVFESSGTKKILRSLRLDKSLSVVVAKPPVEAGKNKLRKKENIQSLFLQGGIVGPMIFCKRDSMPELPKKASAELLSYSILLNALNEGRKTRALDGLIRNAEGVSLNDLDEHLLAEFDNLILSLLVSIGSERMEDIEGSEYNFLIQTRLGLKSSRLPKTTTYLSEKILAIELRIIRAIKGRKARVTVLTPLYNNRHYVRETLKSIDAQTYSDFVYIILDDGSHDNSGKVVANYIKDKPNYFYLYHDNIGEAETVNRGWDICNSEYFTQVNSDDVAMPELLEEMVKGLDKHRDHVIGYSGFYIIDAKGKVTESVLNEKFNLLSDLPKFNCYAATPGAFIRKSAFKNQKKIKDGSYKYINDVKMLWDMALRGKFLYIPKYLGAWRSHEGGISADRYKSADEVVRWLDEFFANENMPAEIKNLESATRTGIYKYLENLMRASNPPNKASKAEYYKQKSKLPMPRYTNLQVGDNDLIGNKFNGHDLHINLRKLNVDASHLVWNKESKDPNTYIIAGSDRERERYRHLSAILRARYKLDHINNHVMCEVLYNKMFLDADIVHFHLMHNGLLDFTFLPLASRLKPVVWHIHDSWIVGGDPIEGNDEGYFFSDEITDMTVSYDIKKNILEASNITYIANSNYTKTMLQASAMFKDKEIHYIPFGIDLSIFKPGDKEILRKKYNIKQSDIVLLARGSGGARKGIDYIEHTVERLSNEYDNIHLIVVGSGGDLDNLAKKVNVTMYDWIKDDYLLADLYTISDIFLMPSRREYFGMMAVEAMACGTLPLVIDGTSLPDAVGAPRHGVSTKRNKQEYYLAVKYYIENKSEREKRAMQCVEYVKRNHDKEHYTKEIDKLYNKIMKDFTISKADQEILGRLKKHYEIEPISKIEIFDKNAIAKTRRLARLTARSVKHNGIRTTSIKVAKKVYRRIKKK